MDENGTIRVVRLKQPFPCGPGRMFFETAK